MLDHPGENIDWAGISGLIVGGYTEMAASVPSVSLMCQRPGCLSVVADEYAGMRAAMKHLIDLGHRRIAYLHSIWSPTLDERVSGYRNGLMDADVFPVPAWRRPMEGEAEHLHTFYRLGRRSMQEWLADGWADLKCTALLTQNDDTALGAIEALRDAGFSVPGDVSVIGFDGISEDGRGEIDLTTVVMPLRELGGVAVRQLRMASDGKSLGLSLKLEAPLHVGATTAENGSGEFDNRDITSRRDNLPKPAPETHNPQRIVAELIPA